MSPIESNPETIMTAIALKRKEDVHQRLATRQRIFSILVGKTKFHAVRYRPPKTRLAITNPRVLDTLPSWPL